MEGRCRRHPEHTRSKGVCPFCLKERLYHLSASVASSASNPTSSPSESDLSSTAASLPNLKSRTTTKRPSVEPEQLQKSRSLAFLIGKLKQEDKGKKDKKKIKHNFWSKLLIGSEKKVDSNNILHSKTSREKPATKWVKF